MAGYRHRTSLGDDRSADLQLLRDCLSLAVVAPERPSARERLEAAVGPELARRLVSSLTANGYR